jgi:nucleoside 2-deoxyribosyltransferase
MTLKVTGGTYLERCHFPEWYELFGSGLRAAIAVASQGTQVEFHTYVGKKDLVVLRGRAAAAGLQLVVHEELPTTIRFDYFHGLSTPVIEPPPQAIKKAAPFTVEGDAVLRFGFLEGDPVVRGTRVVYDPQSPQTPVHFKDNGSTAKDLAIVLNRTEGRLLTGESDPQKIARILIDSENASAVAVKCGSRGCVVCENGQVDEIPAFKTNQVWPIGSGDVFAALFAKHWSVDGKSAAESALLASRATAHFCNTKSLSIPVEFGDAFKPIPIRQQTEKAKSVYLAGPFFSMPQVWMIEEALAALRGQGLNVFSPLHHVGRGTADEVYDKDIQGLVDCDVVFACVDGLDSGTIFEIGYAISIGKPVVAFVQSENGEDLKMLEGSGCVIEQDFVTAIYKAQWLTVT